MPKAERNNTVIAQSEHTEQVEGNHYFPRESVDMSHFIPSDTQYTCARKGKASYFHLQLGGETIQDAAWSYPEPKDAAKNIDGHLAFDTSKGVTVR
jgi:uncharacterized protein (DUF427 family)